MTLLGITEHVITFRWELPLLLWAMNFLLSLSLWRQYKGLAILGFAWTMIAIFNLDFYQRQFPIFILLVAFVPFSRRVLYLIGVLASSLI